MREKSLTTCSSARHNLLMSSQQQGVIISNVQKKPLFENTIPRSIASEIEWLIRGVRVMFDGFLHQLLSTQYL